LTSIHFNDADCLALIEKSPAAVAATDKAAWMKIFARYSLVEDPVGSTPHLSGVYDRRQGYRGRERLSRFYDTFIAPNKIRFQVDRDTVCGLHVVRDLTIEITMSPKVVVRVPMHLLYELTSEAGELKIFRLAAHWELWPMLQQQMLSGWPFLQVGSASAVRMLHHLGFCGMVGFMRALSSVGASGKAQVERFIHAFNTGDAAALARLCITADIEIAFPYGGPSLSLDQLTGEGGEMRCRRLLAAGNVVSATLDYHAADSKRSGVAIFELERRSLAVVALSIYLS
jgi:hypothetical protein